MRKGRLYISKIDIQRKVGLDLVYQVMYKHRQIYRSKVTKDWKKNDKTIVEDFNKLLLELDG